MLVVGVCIDVIDVIISGWVLLVCVCQLIKVCEGDVYDVEVFNCELLVLVIMGDFEIVMQQLVEENGVYMLKIDVYEKLWGNQFFLFGLGMLINFDGCGVFNVNFGYWYLWFMQSGLEWCNDIVFGSNWVSIYIEL